MAAKKIKPYLTITIIVTALFSFLSLKTPLFIEFLEAKTFDMRFIVRGDREPAGDIVIVAIDDESLSRVGRWPWSREKVAHLIDAIARTGAKTIGVDILFPEPQVTETARIISELRTLYSDIEFKDRQFESTLALREKESDVDIKLAQSMAKAGNVVLAFALKVPTIYEESKITAPPDRIYDYPFMIVREGDYYLPIVAEGAIISIEKLVKSAASMGHVYTQYDRDGAIRWEPLYVKLEEFYYPALGMEVARNYLDLGRDDIELDLGRGISMASRFIATDESGRALINYLGRTGTFPVYSAADLMEGKIGKEAIEGKIVLIGATALGTSDTHITPFAQLPGIEKQAAVAENIIHGNFLRKEESTAFLEIAFIFVFGIILFISLPRLDAVGGALLSTALLLGYLILTQYLFAVHHMWIAMLTPSFSVLLLYTSITSYRFLTEERRAKDIKKMFSSYVTERVVNELVEHPEMAKLGGHRREITVLFSDIRGFTTYSEKRNPEEVVSILNEYLTEMTDIVFKWNGTLDKFVGDEIMAFWGAPLAQKKHAELAVRCSLHMIARLTELQKKWIAEGKEPLDIGIGLNTGDVLVGNIGAEGKKMDYTLIGDNVNLGARVEALTRDYKTRLLITEFTYKKVKDLLIEKEESENRGTNKEKIGHVRLLKVEAVKVKGKELPVMIYEITDRDIKSVITL
ncbi:MAG: adenylate/guanylate cyclase domain-containing protein [Deltaproteobacteria bacterium]|nr:adenylate/guanylate cyclase domain-containing protein [Deltaproteobacteria bacterium]